MIAKRRRYVYCVAMIQQLRRTHSGSRGNVLALVAVVICVLIVIGVLVVTYATRLRDVSTDDTPHSSHEADMVIYNFGVPNLDAIDVTQQATRDYSASGHKGFYIFGDVLLGEPVRHNPNFEFASVKEGVQLVAAIDGIVGFVREQPDSGDYEVFLMPNEQSDWIIGYDHVVDVQVKKGDRVKVGDKLGSPARQNNGLLRYEFQVNKNDGSKDGIHMCPSTLLAPSVRDATLRELGDMQATWEGVSGLELYDTGKQKPIGCLMHHMTPAYAQGVAS